MSHSQMLAPRRRKQTNKKELARAAKLAKKQSKQKTGSAAAPKKGPH